MYYIYNMLFENKSKESGKHYLYQHIRLDKNEVFYVGIGTQYYERYNYTRAKAKSKDRNNIWNGITSRTDYKIEILFESNDYSFIKQKEIEVIAKYKRIKDGGILSNLSLGGESNNGGDMSKYYKPVYLYTKDGLFYKEFESIISCTNFLKVSKSVISLSINKNHLIKSYIIKDYKTDKITQIKDIKEKLKERLSKPILQYDSNMNLIKEWVSSSEASRELGISGGHIRECASMKTNRKKSGGFIWLYQK